MFASIIAGLHRSPPMLLLGSVLSMASTLLSVAWLAPPHQAGITGQAAIEAFDTGTALAILGGLATIIISLATLVISTRSKVYEQQQEAFKELAAERTQMITDLRTLLDNANGEVCRLRGVVQTQDGIIEAYNKHTARAKGRAVAPGAGPGTAG